MEDKVARGFYLEGFSACVRLKSIALPFKGEGKKTKQTGQSFWTTIKKELKERLFLTWKRKVEEYTKQLSPLNLAQIRLAIGIKKQNKGKKNMAQCIKMNHYYGRYRTRMNHHVAPPPF